MHITGGFAVQLCHCFTVLDCAIPIDSDAGKSMSRTRIKILFRDAESPKFESTLFGQTVWKPYESDPVLNASEPSITAELTDGGQNVWHSRWISRRTIIICNTISSRLATSFNSSLAEVNAASPVMHATPISAEKYRGVHDHGYYCVFIKPSQIKSNLT